ncbi:zinc metalloprotease HtpX [Candidatus Poribacteria bacterium]
MSMLKTGLLMTVLTVLLVLVGGIIGGETGLVFAFALAAVFNLGSYWFSDKIVLSMHRAQEVSSGQAPELYSIVERLTQKANLPMPRVYIVPTEVPNAFATGRNPKHAVVAVTSGLLNTLSYHEIEAVLGHELAHVKNRDTLISTVAATMAGAITMLASMARWAAIFGGIGGGGDDDDGGGIIGLLLMAILAPIAALLIQLAISRSREYAADRNGARISGAPLALADALRKMGSVAQKHPLPVNPSTAHMFIVNPLKRASLSSLFATHPAIQKRIARLEAMTNR